ncbi:nucleotidyltransferase domain-containing protein [Cyanobacteria bacterium FACHB-63]|nr:nucleotidyltransferase domain-containing protein [Cyanobacteria bacterium FACHB-63]
MNQKLTALLEELRQGLQELYGDRFARLILFGSQARNEATEDSDIDVMVVLRGKVSKGDEIFRMGSLVNDLNLKYDELIAAFPVSELDFEQRTSPFMKNVRKEGITV